jgi:hypothetical protein
MKTQDIPYLSFLRNSYIFEEEINEFMANPQIEIIDIKFTAVGEPDIHYPPRLYVLVYYKIKAGE